MCLPAGTTPSRQKLLDSIKIQLPESRLNSDIASGPKSAKCRRLKILAENSKSRWSACAANVDYWNRVL